MILNQEIIKKLNAIEFINSQYSFADFNLNYQINKTETALEIKISFPFPISLWKKDITQKIKHILKNDSSNEIKIYLSSDIIRKKVRPNIKTLSEIKNIIVISSGKGGVGKSTVTANLAITLQKMGANVGILDADIYGPSQPTLMGTKNQKPIQKDNHFLPIINQDKIQMMSIGFLISEEQAVAWRGPIVNQCINQLLFQTQWKNLDYLLIDLPPGTGDIHLTITQKFPITGAIIVTTPQEIALLDTKKGIDLFNKLNIPILGIIENMSVYICPKCGHQESIFGSDGGKELSEKINVPLMAQLPFSKNIRTAMDEGTLSQILPEEETSFSIYQNAALSMLHSMTKLSKDYSSLIPNILVE